MPRSSWLPTLPHDRSGDPFQAMRKHFDDFFQSMTAGLSDNGSATAVAFAPKIDVSETDKEVTVTAELPGMEEKDVEVKLVGDQLTIHGEKKSSTEDKKDEQGRTWHRIERSWGSFHRSMRLPFAVDADKVSAEFRNGVLTVTLPKPAEMHKAARTIEVKRAN